MPRERDTVLIVHPDAVAHFALLGPDAQVVCIGLGFMAHEQSTPGRVEASLRELERRTGLRKDRVARSLGRLDRARVVIPIGRSTRRGRPTIYGLDLAQVGLAVSETDDSAGRLAS